MSTELGVSKGNAEQVLSCKRQIKSGMRVHLSKISIRSVELYEGGRIPFKQPLSGLFRRPFLKAVPGTTKRQG